MEQYGDKSMKVYDLLKQDVQQPLLDAWGKAGVTVLTACQERVLSHIPIWQGRNALVVAPTSSGKTFVGEVLAARSAYSLKRAIFLVPFKAIAEEKYAEFRERYGEIGISVIISDGDHTLFDQDIRRGDFGIAVIVYEKMAQLLIQSPGILANCSLIVVDEIQLIGDQTRGPSLEMLLAHFLQLQQRPQLIGLSATMSDLGGLDLWLDADPISCVERPVPLWEGVASPNRSSHMENVELNKRRPGLDLTSVSVPQSILSLGGSLETAYRILSAEGPNKQFLLFRTSVDRTITTARTLAHALPADPVAPEVRSRVGDLEQTRAVDFLGQWIDKRVAYHNAGLSLEERRLIEQLFREGVIRFLVTTSTLAAGVNTPADAVIVLDYKRWNSSRRSNMPIPVSEYKNSVGRAGRFGMASEGRSYLIADAPREENLLMANFVFGHTEELKSAIPDFGSPGVLILGLLARGLVKTEAELRSALRNSFLQKSVSIRTVLDVPEGFGMGRFRFRWQSLLMVRSVFHLTLRAAEGFLRSLFHLLEWELPVPDYTTLCRSAWGFQQESCWALASGTGQHRVESLWGGRMEGASAWLYQTAHLEEAPSKRGQ